MCRPILMAVLAAAVLAACSAAPPPSAPSAVARAFQWSAWGGDAGGRRFAPIAQITPANVDRLQPVWTFHTGARAKGWDVGGKLTFEATPLFVHGTLYFSTATGQVFALDAATGKARWRYDAHVEAHADYSELTSRGVTYWRDPQAKADAPCAARLFVPTVDTRLIALDAATGKPCEAFGDHGQLHLSAHLRRTRHADYEFTSPPVVADGTVILGSSIGDNAFAAEARGTVRAFDARTGAPRWHWNPITRTGADADPGHDAPPYPKWNGAANAWGVFSVDAARHRVFIPTGSASPDLYGGDRPGDDAWANSLVALDTRTGQRVWARQLIHHDTWDYDLAAQPMLVTVRRDGQAIAAVVQLTKNGQVFVFRRDDGTPVYPVTERAVPTDGVPGEQLSPTQPYSALPALVRQGPVTPDDAWGLTFWDRNACRKRIAELRSDGMFTPQSLRGSIEMPSWVGGTNWGSGSWNPHTQMLFANVDDLPMVVQLLPRATFERLRKNGGLDGWDYNVQDGTPYAMRRRALLSPLGAPCIKPPWGRLVAVDLAHGRIAWSRPLGTSRGKAPWPFWYLHGAPNLGGSMVTAGGVLFIGAATDGYLRAFDQRDGRVLWRYHLDAPAMATPMSYVVGDRQYVVVAAGGHGKLDTARGDALVAFALPR
ncbi:pyrroloquinoline quinone-dependent dehydrogenase [Oleiagrimonas soli]|uniref:Quinoprotein glucose dehydrogenase n=1 Tax=Oleiagrimonas soli TaxID=1543381 RepID=A0A099CZU0_9GAMM|nr:pyrroloquinoline quinone-dependent dehydrogenase [Oleiagrimonas soli]KGI79097.1 hypothetical protein LF63_0101020 [Oleiagrimonas soli]MBB6184688.1 quinoprotein glucose dehydrogenase [Oleiagrimonas soli]